MKLRGLRNRELCMWVWGGAACLSFCLSDPPSTHKGEAPSCHPLTHGQGL